MSNFKLFKHKTFGHVYGEDVPLPVTPCAWPSLVTPKDPPPPPEGQEPGEPRFELTHLLSKSDPNTQKFIQYLAAMVNEMVPLFNEGRKAAISTDITLFNDGDTFDLEKYPYYKDNFILVARNRKRVPVRMYADTVEERTDLDPELIQGGCNVKSIVQPMVTAHGLSFKLKNVFYFNDNNGVRFGGGTKPLDEILNVLSYDEPASAGAPAVAEAAPFATQVPAAEPAAAEPAPVAAPVAVPVAAPEVPAAATPAAVAAPPAATLTKEQIIEQQRAKVKAAQTEAAQAQPEVPAADSGKNQALNLL